MSMTKFPRVSPRPSSALLAALAASFCAATGGCGLDQPPASEEVEQVRLAIAVVPADVQCVRITAAGTGRTLVRELDAVGGMALTRSLSGLPLGRVTILGEAFAAACDAVTKSAIPAWVSEPVDVSIVLGHSSTIDLAMVRNGRAKVDVSFSDEPVCSPEGAACLSASECCSHRCAAHACAGSDAGAAADADDPDSSAP
jgi:hypothetical protein